MSIIILQHAENNVGGAGRLAACFRDHGFRLDIRRPDLHGTDRLLGVPADLDNVHGLVILGGPQMVTDIEKLPWMAAEVELVKAAHAAAVPVIGICLGAQLIAHALGGKVDWKEKPAFGMQTLSLNVTGQTDALVSGMQWNHPQFFSCSQEVKQLPPGSSNLGSAPGTSNAIFRVGMRTVAFQFHPECDRPQLDALLGSGGEGMAKAGLTLQEGTAQVEKAYGTYARVNDRLCVNLITYMFNLGLRTM